MKYTLYLEKAEGEFQRYCWTGNSGANETWQSTPHREGHSDIKGAAQCSGDTLPRLLCLKAYLMLQKESKANTFVCSCQGDHCSLVFQEPAKRKNHACKLVTNVSPWLFARLSHRRLNQENNNPSPLPRAMPFLPSISPVASPRRSIRGGAKWLL